MRYIWLNGKILPESEAKISVYDSALMFGDMVFEMTRSFNGVQFKLREHLERLYRSIKYVHIPLEMTIDEMEKACEEVQRANTFEPDDEHRLMINVSRGTLPMYAEAVEEEPGTNVMITDFPLRWAVAGMGHLFENGINAVTPTQRAIPAYLLDPKVKNRSRIHYLMANIEVSQYKGDNNWPLLLDPDGHIAEGTGCNFFIILGNNVFTPIGQNVLRGISREFMREICDVKEINITQYDVYNADEAFMTATPFCMLPVTSYNGVPLKDGKVGLTYKILLSMWSKKVGVDIEAQIKSWDKGIKAGVSAYKFK